MHTCAHTHTHTLPFSNVEQLMADLRVVQNAYRNYKQRKAAAVSCSVCAGRIRGFAEANAAWGSERRKGEVHGAVFFVHVKEEVQLSQMIGCFLVDCRFKSD